ncbi:unnamed protein product, partial [Prorocentrum cordatum]
RASARCCASSPGGKADGVAEGLFFFGMEAFLEQQQRVSLGRASACLEVLFRHAAQGPDRMSTKQLHMTVYLTVQFALYGFVDKEGCCHPWTARSPGLYAPPCSWWIRPLGSSIASFGRSRPRPSRCWRTRRTGMCLKTRRQCARPRAPPRARRGRRRRGWRRRRGPLPA